MSASNEIFIYDKKEIYLLTALAVALWIFAFTLGLSLNPSRSDLPAPPKAANTTATADDPHLPQLATLEDPLPTSLELQEQKASHEIALNQVLTEELHQEVLQHRLSLKKPYATELPRQVGGGVQGQFHLQVGSFATQAEAKSLLQSLKKNHLAAFLKEFTLKNGEKWYRLYVGSFATQLAAQKAGAQYQRNSLISSFLVSSDLVSSSSSGNAPGSEPPTRLLPPAAAPPSLSEEAASLR